MALGIKFENEHKLANYNSFLTLANQRCIFQFIDQLLERKSYVPNPGLTENDTQNLATIKNILSAKAFQAIWSPDINPSPEIVSFLILIFIQHILLTPFSSDPFSNGSCPQLNCLILL